jgi:hypothetical protein
VRPTGRPTLAVVVNVRRTANQSMSEYRRRDAARAAWPVRGGLLDELDDATVLVAIAGGRLIGRWPVTDWQLDANGLLVFGLGEPLPADEARVGRAAPVEARWRRGEAWPIKTLPAALFDEDGADTVRIGAFTVTLAANGRQLRVRPPQGGQVLVETVAALDPA